MAKKTSTAHVVRNAKSGRILYASTDPKAFKAAAKAYTIKVTSSKGAANSALKKAGIVTSSGKLTSRYS